MRKLIKIIILRVLYKNSSNYFIYVGGNLGVDQKSIDTIVVVVVIGGNSDDDNVFPNVIKGEGSFS
jgi:hypothetical protein